MTSGNLLLFLLLQLTFLCGQNFALRPRRLRFAACYEDVPKPKALFLSCTNRKGICGVRKGGAHTLKFFFIPKINSTAVESSAEWNTMFPISLPGHDSEACKYMHQCPLVANKLNAYKYKLKIEEMWPSGIYPVIWTIAGEDSFEDILCFKFKIKII